MKKTFITALSICAFAFSAANAADSAINTKENSRRSTIEQIPACGNVLNECKKLGFVAGGFKEGNGLWRNCFYPTIKGKKAATLKGQEVSVAASAEDVASCKAAAKEHLKEAKAKKKAKAAEATAAPAAAAQ
jgi:hypothetical protein